MTRTFAPLTLVLALAVSGCSMAPPHAVPPTQLPATFREAPGWTQAAPCDVCAKGAWWMRFDDPVLNALEARIEVSNQNLAASAAAYRQARASVRENKASRYPGLSLDASASRTEAFETTQGLPITIDQLNTGDRFKLSASASWQPDLWGRIESSVTQAQAQAQASFADLANATLATQGELASTYFRLRALDANAQLLEQTVKAYARTMAITRNRYREGVAARGDVAQAEVQLANAEAQAQDSARQRAIYEHSLAVMTGQNPSAFAIEPVSWSAPMPEVPGIVPSQLLERRPDIAAAERRVAAANAAIGIRKAAFYPTLGLTGSLSTSGNELDRLFTAPASFWSLGGSLAQSLFDFGGNTARFEQARAAHEQAIAQYRQSVLEAFQETEDALAASRVLREVLVRRTKAHQAASRAQDSALQRYLAGESDYTSVVSAQASALQARQSEIQTIADRQVALISLFQAIGGDWHTSASAGPDSPGSTPEHP